jgi:3-isopropylmalate dehydrogenase
MDRTGARVVMEATQWAGERWGGHPFREARRMTHTIAVLPGDGIGPEVVAQAVLALKAVGVRFGLELRFDEGLVGGAAFDATGHPLPDATLELCRRSDAVILGAVGGTKWDGLDMELRPETGALLPLRKQLGLFANLRPARLYEPLASASPLKAGHRFDILIVRELTGGIYFGKKERTAGGAIDVCSYSVEEIERIVHVGFRAARTRGRKLCSVDKANVLETSRLWREVVVRISAEYPDVSVTHMLVDNCAMQLVRDPSQFDVIVTDNLFGDILSDEAAAMTGSLGMLPSASLGDGRFGLYEPVHGSAPDIAGKDVANPMAAILCTGMLLRHSLEAADAVDKAVIAALHDGWRTADIAGDGKFIGTKEMGARVLEKLESRFPIPSQSDCEGIGKSHCKSED